MLPYEELFNTIESLKAKGKGILAADESNATIAKRFAPYNIENTPKNRGEYRSLLANTRDLEKYISGVICFEETFTNKDKAGKSVPELLAAKGILAGIKVDKGLGLMPQTEEHITKGLDDLEERLVHFKNLGAKFAKWRNVYTISEHTPSILAMKAGSEVLARYAALCQANGIVPIVEPEILMDGDHSIDDCAEVAELVLNETFNALKFHYVDLEYIVLKPSMVTSGKSAAVFSSPEEVAEYTISVFRNFVPASVPSINFLSGGQSPKQAIDNLNAINSLGVQPWSLSFSYGRALQEDCLKTWQGEDSKIAAAQEVLLKACKMNSLACLGEVNN